MRSLKLAGLVVLVSAAMAGFVLHYAEYPYPIWRGLILRYLVFHQDLIALALVAAIAIAACLPPLQRPALALVRTIGERPWTTAAATFVALSIGMLYVAHGHALAADEYLTLMQSRIFAAGRLSGEYPPDLLPWLMPGHYRYRWIMASDAGDITATYWPGFAAVLAPFSALGIPWACNPALAALALVLISKLSVRLVGSTEAGGWASLFALASPGFAGLAISYFSMTAHLVANLVFVWLILQRRLVGAGLVGSLALLLHQPVPHILFALPWIVWLRFQPEPRRNIGRLALGYLPGLVVGLAWAAFLHHLHGFIIASPWPSDGALLHRIGNFIWYWQLRSSWIFSAPSDYALYARIAEQVRLWAWTAPGLVLLAGIGWWLSRRNAYLTLLAASFVATVCGYFLVSFDQGYGWGARYVHSAWGALPILAAAAMVQRPQLRGWAAAAAMLSLVLATSLRAWQVDYFMSEHLARRPPHEPGKSQLVFVAHDRDYYYDWDLVQNDPFLRQRTILFLSHGADANRDMVERKFPGARKVHESVRGEVWELP